MHEIEGTPDDDRLRGGRHRDRIDGGAGDDVLIGGDGRDHLFGGDGDDRIYGGADHNLLTGGAGSDRFVFTKIGDNPLGEQDIVMDFQQGEDKVLFRDEFLENGPLHFIGEHAFSGTPGEVRFVIGTSGNTGVSVDLDGDMRPDAQILFIGEVHFQKSDFSF